MRCPSEVVRHRLFFEIDRQPIRLVIAGRAKDMLDVVIGESDREKAVLQTFVVEDIREARTDDGAKTVVAKGPDRVLARAAASKVAARDQDRRAMKARFVEHEVLVLGAIGIQAPIEKETRLETGPHHRL